MRLRYVPGILLLGLVLAAPPARAAEEKPKEPMVVLRLKPIDELLTDARWIAGLINKDEEFKQFEKLIQQLLGEKGLEGIDTKRPIGAYGNLGPNGIDSDVVLLLPVTDQDSFLGLLKKLDLKVDKDKDGAYSTMPPNVPYTIYFRFAHKHVYATIREAGAIKTLLPPEKIFPRGVDIGTLSGSINLAGIPKELREVALGQAERALADLKEKKESETKAQHELKSKIVDEITPLVKSLINDGGTITLKLITDAKSNELALALDFTGKEGSALAKAIKDFGSSKSVVAGLIGSDSAINIVGHLILPENIRKALGPVIDELAAEAIKKQSDAKARENIEKLFKIISPTLKMGELDLALDLRGPSEKGLYTVVFGGKVKDGADIEKTIKEALRDAPREIRDLVVVDADSVGKINIHKVLLPKDKVDEGFKKTLGEGPIYFALREDALFVTVGEQALEAVKKAVKVQPQASVPLRIEASMKQLAKAMSNDKPAALTAARKAFAEKNTDKIVLSLEGGKNLQLRLSMKGNILKFFVEMENAEKNEK